MSKIFDKQFQDHNITEVKDYGDHYDIVCGNSLLGVDKSPCEAAGIVPQSGMSMRTYGGMGYGVRGVDIDGKEVYYRSQQEEDDRHQKEVDEGNALKKKTFEENIAEHDAKYDALPDVFKRRVDKFRGNNPDFRWEYEPYEMMCCEEAVNLADLLKTEKALREWTQMEYDDQMKAVTLLNGGHSGNSMGIAIKLAYFYITDPEKVVQLHGALAPLVGSKEYGCVPRDAKEERNKSNIILN